MARYQPLPPGEVLVKLLNPSPTFMILENRLLALLASSPWCLDRIWWSSRGKRSWGPSWEDRGSCGRLLRLRLLVMRGQCFDFNEEIFTTFLMEVGAPPHGGAAGVQQEIHRDVEASALHALLLLLLQLRYFTVPPEI